MGIEPQLIPSCVHLVATIGCYDAEYRLQLYGRTVVRIGTSVNSQLATIRHYLRRSFNIVVVVLPSCRQLANRPNGLDFAIILNIVTCLCLSFETSRFAVFSSLRDIGCLRNRFYRRYSLCKFIGLESLSFLLSIRMFVSLLFLLSVHTHFYALFCYLESHLLFSYVNMTA